ncbi:hypothetical protein IWZ03DRAFT_376802 [Phyllosticta citriasiana]|uniref:Secreted protein n=1 Tax=Phyllosticta citriasiana TaxID=595635 RepID=A0ABR1KS92_9PEZI
MVMVVVVVVVFHGVRQWYICGLGYCLRRSPGPTQLLGGQADGCESVGEKLDPGTDHDGRLAERARRPAQRTVRDGMGWDGMGWGAERVPDWGKLGVIQ